MKKISLLFVLFTVTAFAQQPESYVDLNASNQNFDVSSPQAETSFVRVDNGRMPVVQTYADRATFQADYGTDCSSSSGLIFEDFVGGPTSITPCGITVGSAGGGCFSAGDLEAGFEITALGGNNETVIYIPNGAIGNTTPLMGATSFADYTIVTFPNNDVYAVGMDIWENNDPTTEYRIYDQSGTLLETYSLTTPINTATFFGFIADEVIGRIEIEGQNGSGELLGQLEFGSCSLSVDENLLSQVAVYPNPTSVVLNVNVPASVEINEVVLYDILGKNTGLSLKNGTINTSSLERGIYLLSLKTSAGILTQKVVKQ